VSGDEVLVLLFSVGVGGAGLLYWYRPILLSPIVERVARERLALIATPPVALVLIFAVIMTAGSYDVRGDPRYLLLYTVLGAVWIFVASQIMHGFNISFRDDALERRNPAAVIVVVCAMLAHAAIYAGANIGDGPGWWCVVAAALIGSAAWFLMWALVAACCSASEEIAIERDVPSAIRFGGYMLAMGLICARGSAGDWTSLEQTFIEFQAAWPVLPLTLAVIVLELVLRRRPRDARPQVNASIYFACAYLAVAVIAVQQSEPLPNNPQYDRPAP
jgi:hypothetical protein